MPVLADLFKCRTLAEPGNICIFPRILIMPPCMVGAGYFCNIIRREVPVHPVDELAHLPGVDEEGLPAPVPEPPVLLVPGDKPEAGRDLRGIEELPGQSNHAVNEVRLDDPAPDLPLAGLVGRH